MSIYLADIHCHILPGFDDGPAGITEALELARAYSRLGYSHVIATPHLQNIYDVEEDLYEQVERLQNYVLDVGIDLDILPGAEILLSPDLPVLLKEKALPTLNRTRYVLTELPLFEPFPDYAEGIYYKLLTEGYIPILAHPERNRCFSKKPELLEHLVELGVLLQVDTASLAGNAGGGALNTARYLLKRQLVSFISNNLHGSHGKGEIARLQMSTAWSRAKRYGQRNKLEEVFFNNPENLIRNIPISQALGPQQGQGLLRGALSRVMSIFF